MARYQAIRGQAIAYRRATVSPSGLVGVTAATNRPTSIPDFNRLVIASLMCGYVDSLLVGQALYLRALRSVPFVVPPNKSVGCH